MKYRRRSIGHVAEASGLDNLTEASDFMCAMCVNMSLGLGLRLGCRIALIGTLIAATRACLGRAGLGVRPRALLTDAAVDGVGAGRDDGPVVVGEHVRRTGDGSEECIGGVAVPAGG